ncbi:hypothetical protein ACFPM1_07680 [Halorubrum rubrum]|uniref:Uncharacterized protein n=1 Tax=Halorubrum rubrum TaxID=1126240 RepID=A0ABD5R167_9EURY|nr:hypothetical protein [Halorubrum rubrum]
MAHREDFHENAHLEATEITGDRDYGEWGQCIVDPASSTGERCTQPAKGSHGKCHSHGGSSSGAPEGNNNAEGNDGGAPEDNTNAVTHALYVESNRFYQEVIGDALRDLCDEIYQSYVEKFHDVNGEPIVGEKARLSEIAVNHIKVIHADNWAINRPDDLDTGNALVDRETRVKASQSEFREEVRYKESVVVKTQQRLRKEDRKWLKEMGLLGADELDVNVDGQVDHDHSHGLDEDTREMIDDLEEDLKA